MRSLVAVAIACLGCARAGSEFNRGNDGGLRDGPRSSADGKLFFDAPVDGPPGTTSVTLSETTNNTMVYGNSVACSDSVNGNTRDNIWYRAFQLSDFSITNTFHVTSVTFSVQEASNSSAITVKVGSYTGAVGGSTIDTTMIAPVAMATTTPPNTNGTSGENVNVPLTGTIAAGGKLVVEIVEPDMDTTGYMYIGATTAGESKPGYISSAICNTTTPETTVAAGGTGQIIITVTGTH